MNDFDHLSDEQLKAIFDRRIEHDLPVDDIEDELAFRLFKKDDFDILKQVKTVEDLTKFTGLFAQIRQQAANAENITEDIEYEIVHPKLLPSSNAENLDKYRDERPGKELEEHGTNLGKTGGTAADNETNGGENR